MSNILKIDLKKNLKEYMKNRTPLSRCTSYDYCYNYFFSFYRNDNIKAMVSKENLKLISLHLGYYLASWGMYRGSGWLLKSNFKILEPVIKYISTLEPIHWMIDVDSYQDGNNINQLLKIVENLKNSFSSIYIEEKQIFSVS